TVVLRCSGWRIALPRIGRISGVKEAGCQCTCAHGTGGVTRARKRTYGDRGTRAIASSKDHLTGRAGRVEGTVVRGTARGVRNTLRDHLDVRSTGLNAASEQQRHDGFSGRDRHGLIDEDVVDLIHIR